MRGVILFSSCSLSFPTNFGISSHPTPNAATPARPPSVPTQLLLFGSVTVCPGEHLTQAHVAGGRGPSCWQPGQFHLPGSAPTHRMRQMCRISRKLEVWPTGLSSLRTVAQLAASVPARPREWGWALPAHGICLTRPWRGLGCQCPLPESAQVGRASLHHTQPHQTRKSFNCKTSTGGNGGGEREGGQGRNPVFQAGVLSRCHPAQGDHPSPREEGVSVIKQQYK